MNDALKKLEDELAKNQGLLSDLTQQIENIQNNNEHLMYTIALLKKSPSTRNGHIVPQSHSVTNPIIAGKKTLRATILDSIGSDEKVTIGDVWSRVTETGISTSKATINTTMAGFVNKKVLVRTGLGIYKKP